jgi:ApbE superfamily uncharacterized protein (UPF0280 family)
LESESKLYRRNYHFRETKGTIISDKRSSLDVAESSIQKNRKELEEYLNTDLKFKYSLQPIDVINAPNIANLMANVGKKAGVGPMAAVAGVLADLAVEAMIKNGSKVAVVENGGEASMMSCRPISVTIAAGNNELSRKIGFLVEEFPHGVATSSGRHSHALSFGNSDSVTVFAENAGLADAAATRIGNMVINQDEKNIEKALHQGLKISGVKGILIIIDEKVGTWGKLPKIINLMNS